MDASCRWMHLAAWLVEFCFRFSSAWQGDFGSYVLGMKRCAPVIGQQADLKWALSALPQRGICLVPDVLMCCCAVLCCALQG